MTKEIGQRCECRWLIPFGNRLGDCLHAGKLEIHGL